VLAGKREVPSPPDSKRINESNNEESVVVESKKLNFDASKN
jgi:hypothetical protein